MEQRTVPIRNEEALNAPPFRPRFTTYVRRLEAAGWALKAYWISAAGDPPDESVFDEVEELAQGTLPQPARGEGRHGVGFVIVHRGDEATWVLLDWWTSDLLRHLVFRMDPSGPERFVSVPPPGPTACVWELAVIGHERRAWINHVLSVPAAPDFRGYMSDRMPVIPAARADGEGVAT